MGHINETERQLVRWVFDDMETSHPQDPEPVREYLDIPTLEEVNDIAEQFNCKGGR